MKSIYDRQIITRLVEDYQICQYFDTNKLEFQCFQYLKGELLCSPLNRTEYLLVLVSGTVQIYDLRPDGRQIPVSLVSGVKLFGDIEFCAGNPPAFFAEALEEVICLAIPIEKYKETLNNDLRFLHCLLNSLLEKIEFHSDIEIPSQTLEEKVMLYLRFSAENNEICGVEKALMQLKCSRRQLQRVLKKLSDSGAIVKLKRGCYRLNDKDACSQI